MTSHLSNTHIYVPSVTEWGPDGLLIVTTSHVWKAPSWDPNDENSISPQLLDDTKWDQWQIIKDQDWLGDNCQVPTV